MRRLMILVGLLGVVSLVCAADLSVGIWKLNPAKTQMTGPGVAYKSGTVRIEAQPDGIKFIYDNATVEGKTAHGEYAAKYDGKDYPIKGDPDMDAVALWRIDDYTVDYSYKKRGKEVMKERAVISKDGKTATVVFKGKNAKGQDFSIVTVWDKQ